jgi:hypothetical protein
MESGETIRALSKDECEALVLQTIADIEQHPTSEAKKRGFNLLAHLRPEQWHDNEELSYKLWQTVMAALAFDESSRQLQ